MKKPKHRSRIYTLLICAVAVPVFFALIGQTSGTPPADAVTYAFSGGRFGDNLLAYLHGKWASYKYNMPLLYRPFPYSDQLCLHEQEDACDSAEAKRFRKIDFARFEKVKTSKRAAGRSFLYEVPYFPEFEYELSQNRDASGHSFFSFEVDWKDPEFRREITTLVQPIAPVSKPKFPPDCLTVALHMRKGGGFDSQDINLKIPLKAPPEQFYIDALHKIRQAFPSEKLYVYIFTDDHAPSKIADALAISFRGHPIIFDYRHSRNTEKDNVLEDFFAMLEFDCLIRPESNYSYVASKLKDYKIVLSPTHVTWENGLPTIDKIKVEQ